MKILLILFATIVLLGLTTSANNYYYGAKKATMAKITSSEAAPVNPSLAPCTCSCGKNRNGSCTAHVANCGLVDGIQCIYDCCQRAPNPRPEECSGGIVPEE